MPLEGVSVFIATPCTRDISVPTVRSYLDTQEACIKNGVPVEVGFVTGSLVHHARTLIARRFLKGKATRLFWIDSDIVWSPQDFFRILAHSTRHECVVGVYPRRADPPRYYVRMTGTEPDDYGLTEIEGTGLGFACIHRKVIEQLAAKAPQLVTNGELGPSIFRLDRNGNEDRGEDYAFWSDVMGLGYRIYADTLVDLGHIGSKVYRRPSPPPMPAERTHANGTA